MKLKSLIALIAFFLAAIVIACLMGWWALVIWAEHTRESNVIALVIFFAGLEPLWLFNDMTELYDKRLTTRHF